jgi:glycosyltransferase involved in cell wall biosynthesis
MWRCADGRLPAFATPLAIPYMKWDLSDKQQGLRQADAIIAVSQAMAAELLLARIPSVVLPNLVDASEVNAIADETPQIPLPDRFVLFVGKLEANKGAADLIPALVQAKAGLPLVLLGSGSEERPIREQAARASIEVQAHGWADRADVLRAMKRTEALVFPSIWPEPLSRVLLEALALGTPVAAMDTGGTAELLEDGTSGLLARTVEELGNAVSRIVHDPALRSRLKDGATDRARAFSPEVLVPRYEAVYRGAS